MMSYCKIFVYYSGDVENIVQKLVNEIDLTEKSQPASTYYLATRELNISVFNNKEHDPQKIDDPLDGFLFFPIIFDVEAANAKEIYEMDTNEKHTYLNAVLNLVNILRKISLSVVPACDFEDYLNNSEPASFSQQRPLT